MRVKTKRAGDTLIVRIIGDFDLHTAPAFRRAVDEQFGRVPRLKHLVVNFEEVSFIDSSGLGALLGRLKHVHGRRGRLIAVGLRPRVHRLLETAGLLKFVQVAENERGALQNV